MPSPIFSDDGRPESYTNSSLSPGGDGGGGQTNFMSDFRPAEIQAGSLGSTTQGPSAAQQICLLDDDDDVSPRSLGGGGNGSGSHGGGNRGDDDDDEEEDDDMTGPGSLFQGPPAVHHQLLKRPGTLGFSDVKADKLLVPNNGNSSGGGGSGDSHRHDLDPMTGSGVGGNINSASSTSTSTSGGNLYQQGHSSLIKQETDAWNIPSPASAPHTAIATTAAESQMKIEPSLVVSEYSGNNSPISTLPGHVIISNNNQNSNNNNNSHHYQNNIDINKNQGAAPFTTVNTPLASNFSSPFLAPSTRSQPCVPIFNLVDYTTAQPLSPTLSQQSHSSPTPSSSSSSSAAAAHYLPQAPTSNGTYSFGFDHAGDDLSLSPPCSAGYTPISNTTGSSSCPVTPGGAFHHPAASGGIGVTGLISAAGSPFIRDGGIWTSGPGSPLSSVFDSQSDSGYCASEPYGMGVNLGPAASSNAATLGGTVAASTVSGNNSSGNSPTQDEPYAKLIYRALMSREDKTMTLQEIYQWFRDNTAKTVGRGKGWQNSIRHNLSMNKGFCKNYRKPNSKTEEPRDLTLYAVHCPDVKRATSWRLEPWAVENGIQSTTRYRKGTKRRGVAASASATAATATNTDAFRPPRSSPYGYQQPQYHQPQGQHPYHVQQQQQQQQQQQRRLGPGPHRAPPRSYRGGDPFRSMGRQAVMNRSATDTPRSHMVAGPYYYHHGQQQQQQQQQQQLPEPGSPGPMAAEPGAASHHAHAHHHHAGSNNNTPGGSGGGSSGGYVGYPVPGDMTTWVGYPPDDHHHSHPHHVSSAGAGAGRAAHGRVAAPMDINYGYEDWDVHSVDF
ncbi:hypothetical protein N3K66_005721 [Trichothecium roseum]|uniref:Uncharacterized protein n=1 Tax=Trichothecium roseum TaxID=47278 RepID=A0ACC0UZE1_9HYPO|nr:hypothetical protein N3K66_005721 [Trichothecium roseum]